jgi:hypothetical protein
LGDLKDLISGTKEDLEDQLESVRQAIKAADASLREALLEDQTRLQSSLDSIARAQQIADTTRPKVIVEDNRAGQGSRAIFGTDTFPPGFSLTVARNEAGDGVVYSAGVHSPQTLQALLQHSRTLDPAITLQVLQVLQTQSTSFHNETVQSVLNDISAGRNQVVPHAPVRSLLTELDSSGSVSLRQPVRSVQSVSSNVETQR